MNLIVDLQIKSNQNQIKYKVNKTKKILSDKMKYESFMCRMRKKLSIVNVTCKKREIKEE